VAEVVAATFGSAGDGQNSRPGLATILVGDNPDSAVYVANKRRAIREAGLTDFHRSLSGRATQDEVAAAIDELAADPLVAAASCCSYRCPRGWTVRR
jgi:methylenetetrahydrofolate dehydrogenase (NADP+) / methenyltetrahydrofolate cyclohydrolase